MSPERSEALRLPPRSQVLASLEQRGARIRSGRDLFMCDHHPHEARRFGQAFAELRAIASGSNAHIGCQRFAIFRA